MLACIEPTKYNMAGSAHICGVTDLSLCGKKTVLLAIVVRGTGS